MYPRRTAWPPAGESRDFLPYSPESELFVNCCSPPGHSEGHALRRARGIRFGFQHPSESRFLAPLGMTISLLRRIHDSGHWWRAQGRHHRGLRSNRRKEGGNRSWISRKFCAFWKEKNSECWQRRRSEEHTSE